MATCQKHGEPLPGCRGCHGGAEPQPATSSVSRTPFVPAEIVASSPAGATIRYSRGWNCSGTQHHEVIQIVRHPDGAEHRYVIMRGLSPAKASAIALILNAPED